MNWVNIIIQGVLIGGLYAMFAAGLALIFGVMRLVNIAHGDLIVLAAYIAGRALGPGAEYLHVFRFTGATAFMCYTVAGWQASIWYRRPWATTLKNTFDGFIYACLTAGAFGWLWPG